MKRNKRNIKEKKLWGYFKEYQNASKEMHGDVTVFHEYFSNEFLFKEASRARIYSTCWLSKWERKMEKIQKKCKKRALQNREKEFLRKEVNSFLQEYPSINSTIIC